MPTESSRSLSDRRRVPRGGRRQEDRAGKYPPLIVAESYDGVRETCSRYLDRFNFQVLQAANGEQVLAQVAAEPPHVILAELYLPAMPAWRLAQWLAQNWRTKQVRVIVLAGAIDSSESQDFRNHVAGVLVKPFSLRMMLDEIRRVLRAGAASDPRPVRP